FNMIYVCEAAGVTGGIKQSYRHVEHLLSAGRPASIVYLEGEPARWFEHSAPGVTVEAALAAFDRSKDWILVNEAFGAWDAILPLEARVVVLNQSIRYGFAFQLEGIVPCLQGCCKAILTVSESSRDFLRLTFPNVPNFRVTNGI